MDNFVSLSNRLLTRCPQAGILLCEQFVNDAWKTLQASREWSFRRRFGTFAPPTMYVTGYASTNVGLGDPTMITGTGTAWTASMVGRQIRIGGLLFPFYTIVAVLSPTSLLIDTPWAGDDLLLQSYQILQAYYPVPTDFGYMYCVVSIKDSYRLWLNVTEGDLAMLDPQRTNFGQTYSAVFRGYTDNYGGTIGPVLPVSNPLSNSPVSTTATGYSYVTNATYIIQVVGGGTVGTATFKWLRSGQIAFTAPVATTLAPQDLSDGVQIYWPAVVNYTAGDLYVINCVSQVGQGSPFYELWPAPTYSQYLYPYIYTAKEYDISNDQPTLPPLIANRGDVILEAALQKCAEFPGKDMEHINIYHDLRQAAYHAAKLKEMMVDLQRNDEEVGVSLIDYESYPFAPAPWDTGQWQQTHAPYLNG